MKLSLPTAQILKSGKAEQYLTTILPRLAEKKVQSYTTIVLSLVTIAFFGIFAIGPTLSTITDLQKQVDDSTFVDQQLGQKINTLTALQEAYTLLKPDLPVVFDAIPQQPDLALFVSQIQGIGKLTNVQVSNAQTLPVDVGNQTVSGKFTTFAFSLDVNGTRQEVFDFLDKLTTYNRLVSIDILSLTSAQTTTDSYRVSVRGKAYFKPN